MEELTPLERLERTLRGEEIDRIATYDIIHNVDLIEHLAEKKITSKNALDLLCKAAKKILDLIRHFAIPDDLEVRLEKDEDGFVYKREWWTKTFVHRPFETVDDAARMVEKDIKKISDCIDKKKVCWQALQHLQLFGEDCEYLEEVVEKFRVVAEKLNPTQMIVPESLPGIYIAISRYDFKWFTYLQYDYPELLDSYLQALCDYEIARIESFAGSNLTKIAFLSEPTAFNDRLIWPLEWLREHEFPMTKRVIDAWKKYGYYVIYFSDGHKWPVLDDVTRMDIDAVDPCEPLAGMDVKRFRDKYPDITICQPIDCQFLLAYGTHEEIKEATIKAIKASGGKRLIMGSSSEIHPEIPVANAMAMYKTTINYKLN
ncbi:MAG: uroporphyrinogen decarboxylase family protein [Actinobacteria bacterium]|nr:uroporphyrinogen decarboxylase family protein [Actinomycetota bacterium]